VSQTVEATADSSLRLEQPIGRWDLRWLNRKLLVGAAMVLFVVLLGLIGPFFWNTTLARAASSPLNLPPAWLEGGSWAHPLGTESLGRDMLALIIESAPAALRVGLIAAGLGMLVAIVLGFSAGFLGGWVDDVIRSLADATVTIPALAVLIVLAAFLRNVSVESMALLLALFAWAGPTRLIRSQVLTLRERGYVRMARLSGLSTFDIMFKEMLPNMLPYVAASLVGNVSAAILAATSLEALGLGPTRIPTLGTTIFYAIKGSAVLRGMWWWWGLPILVLVIIFSGLFLIAIGLDEIANPRLKRFREA
jgi:peptide/nickel transport system permease protein